MPQPLHSPHSVREICALALFILTATARAAPPASIHLSGLGEQPVQLQPTAHPSIHIGHLAGDPDSRVVYIEHRGVIICEVRSQSLGVFTSPATDRLGPLSVPHKHEGPTCACEHPDHAILLAPVQASHTMWRGMPVSRGGVCDDPAVVDLLVYYTTEAMIAAGGEAEIEAEILLGLANTNTALLDSNIPASVNLVASLELDYTETGSAFTDIDQIRSINDGVADEIHATRDELRADLVMLVTDTSAPCGIAGYGLFAGATPAPDNSFSVINRNCIGGGWSSSRTRSATTSVSSTTGRVISTPTAQRSTPRASPRPTTPSRPSCP